MHRLRLLLIVLVVAGLLGLLVERLIVTDREALEAWADAAEDAAESDDERRLTELLAPDFEMGPLDRGMTVIRALRARKENGVLSVDVQLHDVEIEGDTATANGVVETLALGRRWRVESRLTFRRYPEGWALAAAEPVDPVLSQGR